MSIFIRFFCVICLLLASMPVKAEELVYTDIEEGEPAPFTGLLYTQSAISKILSDHSLEIDRMKIDYEYQIKVTNNDWESKYDILQKKYDLEVQMYEDMIMRRDNIIDSNAGKRFKIPDNVKFVGGIVVGAAITITIAYSLDTLAY